MNLVMFLLIRTLGILHSFRWMLSLNSCLYNHLPFCPFWGVLFSFQQFPQSPADMSFHLLCWMMCFTCWFVLSILLQIVQSYIFWFKYHHKSELSWILIWGLCLSVGTSSSHINAGCWATSVFTSTLSLIRAGVVVCRSVNALSAMPRFELFDCHLMLYFIQAWSVLVTRLFVEWNTYMVEGDDRWQQLQVLFWKPPLSWTD